MNGIKMSDCKFYVDKEARTIICVVSNTQNLMHRFMWENFQFPDIDFTTSGNKLWKSLQLPHSFMGKAVCAQEDEWDEELGKKIAFSRAKDKCYKSFFKRANLLVQTIDKRLGHIINIFNDFGLKLSEKREALEQQIDERMPHEDKEDEE